MSETDDQRDRLEAHLRSLQGAWSEFEHQARRYGDARERAGGILHDVDAEVRQLFKNLDANEAEQADVKARIAKLKANR